MGGWGKSALAPIVLLRTTHQATRPNSSHRMTVQARPPVWDSQAIGPPSSPTRPPRTGPMPEGCSKCRRGGVLRSALSPKDLYGAFPILGWGGGQIRRNRLDDRSFTYMIRYLLHWRLPHLTQKRLPNRLLRICLLQIRLSGWLLILAR